MRYLDTDGYPWPSRTRRIPLTIRGTIFLEEAEILEHRAYPAEQYIVTVSAPEAARHATPGSFAHIRCDPGIPLRRPLSIMRAERASGRLQFLYKPVGAGLAALATREPGERISVLAPIGRGFEPDPARPRILAVGGGVGIPPIVFLAEELRERAGLELMVMMGSEVPFPFDLVPATRAIDGVPETASQSLALFEQWGIESRLASGAGLAGCFDGFVTDLANGWLRASTKQELARTQIVSCGPEPMLRATAELAYAYDLPCQVAVEEYMACGVGGCAGCTLEVHGANGAAMKRVCVDGPVFDVRSIYAKPSIGS